MKIGLQQRSRLEASGPAGVTALAEFQSLFGALAAWTNTEHDDDGHHTDITATSITLAKIRDAALRIVSGWLDAGGGVAFSGAVTPASLTGDVENYSPPGIEEAFLLRLSSSIPVSIGGIKDGGRLVPIGGRVMAVFNAGAQNITLVHEDIASDENFRFRMPGFLDMIVTPNNFALLYYDAKSRRWAMLSSSSGTGGTTSSEFNAGDSGANITLDWANGTQQIVNLTHNANISLVNPVEGQLYRLMLTEGGGGGFTPDFVSPTIVFENDVLKAASIAAGETLQVSLYYTLLNGGQYFAAYTTPELELGISASDITLTDTTTNNVTSSAHGFAPKSSADATKFLNGAATPAYAAVKDSDLSTSDITTNNMDATKHGFATKAPGDATKFLNGLTGTWTVPIRTLLSSDGSVPGGNTVASTNVETAFASTFTIPANDLAVGDVLRLTLRGVFGTDVAPPTLQLKAYAGATAIADTTALTATGSLTNQGWSLEIDVIVTAIGVSGVFEVQGVLTVTSAAHVATVTPVFSTSTFTIDTTASKALTVKVTWGTSSANNTITLRQWIVERLRG